jgi:hypothetical protein
MNISKVGYRGPCFSNLNSYIECAFDELSRMIQNMNLIMSLDKEYFYSKHIISGNYNQAIKYLDFYTKRYQLNNTDDKTISLLRDSMYNILSLTQSFLNDEEYAKRISDKEPVLDIMIDMNLDLKIKKDKLFKSLAITANNNFEPVTKKSVPSLDNEYKLPYASSPTIASATIINNSPTSKHRLAPFAKASYFEARTRTDATRVKKRSRYFKVSDTRKINRSKKKVRSKNEPSPKGIKI